MKRLALSLLAITAISTAYAQSKKSSNISAGFTLGGNYATISGAEGTFKPGFNVGLNMIWAPREHWGFGGEVKYSLEGGKNTLRNAYGPYDANLNTTLHYVRIPLRATYFFGQYSDNVRAKVFAGPTFGILAGHSVDVSFPGVTEPTLDMTNYATPSYNVFDFGLHAGGGVNIKLAPKGIWLSLDAAYTQGLIDVSPDISGTNLNQNISLNAGISIPFGYAKAK